MNDHEIDALTMKNLEATLTDMKFICDCNTNDE